MKPGALQSETNLLWRPEKRHVMAQKESVFPSDIEDSEDEFTLISWRRPFAVPVESDTEESEPEITWHIDERRTQSREIEEDETPVEVVTVLDETDSESSQSEDENYDPIPHKQSMIRRDVDRRDVNARREEDVRQNVDRREDVPELTQTDTQPTTSPLTSMVERCPAQSPKANSVLHPDTMEKPQLPEIPTINVPQKCRVPAPNSIIPKRVNKSGSLSDIINKLNYRGPAKIGLSRRHKIESLHKIKK